MLEEEIDEGLDGGGELAALAFGAVVDDAQGAGEAGFEVDGGEAAGGGFALDEVRRGRMANWSVTETADLMVSRLSKTEASSTWARCSRRSRRMEREKGRLGSKPAVA